MGRKSAMRNCGPSGLTNTLEKYDGKAQITTHTGIQIAIELFFPIFDVRSASEVVACG
jgi:hypothetical protein